MGLPPEKISQLKQIIHQQMSQADIHSRIQNYLSSSAGRHGDEIHEDELLDALRGQGLVSDIVQQLKVEPVSRTPGVQLTHDKVRFIDKKPTVSPRKQVNVDPRQRYLYLQIIGGRAFLEHLHQSESHPTQTKATFTLHVHWRGQRFRSKAILCACDPEIKEGFLLEVLKDSGDSADRMVDSSSMLAIPDSVHLVLIKTDQSGDNTLLSSHFIEWRTVLTSPNGKFTTALELMGIGTESKVPVGILDIQLELLPRPQPISEDVLSTQISLEKSKQAERERLFLVYAKQWWQEYLQIRAAHRQRLVKIFAQDENAINRPVCCYIQPLRAGRLIDTPREAARFVSLIGYEKAPSVGGGERSEQWSTMHAFLTRNKGDSEDHAVLLCSLLLGFGLQAYVCIGTKSKGACHAWVMTVAADGLVTFWESLTAHRYIHHPKPAGGEPGAVKPAHSYRTVATVFNNKCFYANCQPSDLLENCHFDFHNEAHWKSMSEAAVISISSPGALVGWPTLPPLCASILDSSVASNDLEQEIGALVANHRKDQGLTTVWDNNMSYLLTMALSAYEVERVTGVTCSNDDFQNAIRQAVPDGHTFKGYPIQFIHRNARKILATCMKSPVCEEILNCRGDHVRLALRVRAFPYPESACAVWIMFACKYKSVV